MASTRLGTYSQIKGTSVKMPCKVATTANSGLSGVSAIDGISISAGDRILVWKQSTGSANGIYVAAAGAWSRAVDMSLTDDVYRGLQVYVYTGTTYTGATYMLTSPDPITLDSSNLVFEVYNSGGGGSGASFSGTANTVPKYATATTLGDSRIRENGTGDIILSGSCIPHASVTYNLGSATYRWNVIYTADMSLKNEYGDYTLVEGENDLFLYNNKSKKVFKFNLTEVDPSIVPPKKKDLQ